jgi:hypothetical protein
MIECRFAFVRRYARLEEGYDWPISFFSIATPWCFFALYSAVLRMFAALLVIPIACSVGHFGLNLPPFYCRTGMLADVMRAT